LGRTGILSGARSVLPRPSWCRGKQALPVSLSTAPFTSADRLECFLDRSFISNKPSVDLAIFSLPLLRLPPSSSPSRRPTVSRLRTTSSKLLITLRRSGSRRGSLLLLYVHPSFQQCQDRCVKAEPFGSSAFPLCFSTPSPVVSSSSLPSGVVVLATSSPSSRRFCSFLSPSLGSSVRRYLPLLPRVY
jgi:hypothetical protein